VRCAAPSQHLNEGNRLQLFQCCQTVSMLRTVSHALRYTRAVIFNMCEEARLRLAIELDETAAVTGVPQLLAFGGYAMQTLCYANRSHEQPEVKTLFVLSTVNSVLTICHGKQAPASAWTVGKSCEGFLDWPSQWWLTLAASPAYRGPHFGTKSKKHWMQKAIPVTGRGGL
jgi:hypothetical protein